MAARLRRGTAPAFCTASTGMPAQNAATNLKPLVPNTQSPSLHMVQYVADWVAKFPVVSIPLCSFAFTSLFYARVAVNHHHVSDLCTHLSHNSGKIPRYHLQVRV